MRCCTSSGSGCSACASATRWTRTPTWARSTAPRSCAHRGAGRRRRGGGRHAALDRVRAARARLLVRADDLHRRRAGQPDRGRGDLRPGRVGHDVPHARRGDRAGQQLRLRPGGRRVDRQGVQGLRGGSALRAGVVWQNTYNKFDPTAAFGGYKESGFGREGGVAACCPMWRCSREPPGRRRQDLQDVRGRRVRAFGVGPHDATTDRAASTWPTSRAGRARTCATR